MLIVALIILAGCTQEKKIPLKQKSSISIGSYFIDTSGDRLIKTIVTDKNSVRMNAVLYGNFPENQIFDLAVFVNYQKADFRLNSSELKKIHRIKVDRIPEYSYNIEVDGIEPGINDILLVYIRQPGKKKYDDDFLKSAFNTYNYFIRATVKRNPAGKTKQAPSFEFYQQKSPRDFLSGVHVYRRINPANKDFLSLMRAKANQTTKLALVLDTTVLDLSKNQQYKHDKAYHARERFALLAFLNGTIVPFSCRGTSQQVLFGEKLIGQSVILYPEVAINKKGYHELAFLVVMFPYELQEQFEGTYNTTRWESILVSNEVLIEAR